MPVSNTIKYGDGSVSPRLAMNLLRVGEYEAVARFYDRVAQINVAERQALAESARAIRAGRMPEWYQLLAEREAQRR